MKIEELNDAILAVCPIDGLNADGIVWFKPEATEDQKQAAKALMEANLQKLNTKTVNEVLLAQIVALEATMTPRRIREAIKDPSWMEELETKIAALRAQLTKE